ncbi:unnamed protein product [Cladocopium goreaui]|uniref:Uncharacterized protein n=1 Tax=Cladocopium goreaui TaxID=2562237 RepID=A0A9P1DEH2_9DINO|nr:unnamed protein product [Cladocopium goreaui]
MIKNELLYVGVLVISFSSTKVATDECLSFLKSGAALGVDLSERELCILATAVVEIKQKYKIDPMQIPLVIQVDQNFTRQRYVRSNPWIACCTIPNGKYVLTKTWRVLTAQDHAALQGLAEPDFYRFKMHLKDPRNIKRMAGDAFSIPINIAAFFTLLSRWKPV